MQHRLLLTVFIFVDFVGCCVILTENLPAGGYMSSLFLLRLVFMDVCGRTAHVSQAQREAQY